MLNSFVISTLYLGFLIYSLYSLDNKLFAIILFVLSFCMFIFWNSIFRFDPSGIVKYIKAENISRLLYSGLFLKLTKIAFYTFNLILFFNFTALLMNLMYRVDKLGELLLYFNFTFGVILFSVLVNMVLVGYKILEIKTGGNRLSWRSVTIRNILGILLFASFGMLFGFSSSIISSFFFWVFIVSVLYYFYNEKYEKYNLHILDGIDNNDNRHDVKDNRIEVESLREIVRGPEGLPDNLAQNVKFLKLAIEMLNFRIPSGSEPRSWYIEDINKEVKVEDIRSYISSFSKIKESIINRFILDLVSLMYSEVDFQSKLNFILHLLFTSVSQGRKSVPTMIIGYLIYFYQNSTSLEEEESKYLRQKIKEVISNYTLKTPVRMVEVIIFWQYMHFLEKGEIPSIKSLPKFVKRKFRKVFENYSPLTLKKAKLLKKSIKLKDLIKVLHPRPKNRLMAILYSGIIQDSKISKLKETEITAKVVKSQDMLKKQIETLPIQALLRNLSKINFEDTEVFEKVKERLVNVVNSMHKLRRYVNIFDFYIPIFVIPQEDIIKISKRMKDFQLRDLKNRIFSPYEISQHVLSTFFVNSIIDNLGFSFDFEKIEKLAIMIDFLLLLEEILKIKNSKIQASDYIVLSDYRTRELIEQGKIKIDQIFDEASYDREKWMNRQKMKDLLNHVISLYFSEYKINKKIYLIISKSLFVHDILNLSLIVSYITSLYSDFEILIYNGKEIKDYTQLYKEITEYTKPIDKYLKTFSFITSLYVQNVHNARYIFFYESVANYLFSNHFSSNNFLILDYFTNLESMSINSINVFELFSRGLSNSPKKVIVYNYSKDYQGDNYFNINGVHFISSIIHPFTFEIIDRFFD
ncbi:MAG: hypothetical protein N2657_03730 [bacterium]|nr:hypothetical protein [bacterium]